MRIIRRIVAGLALSGILAHTPPTAHAQIRIPPLSPSVILQGFTHQWQGWNNCGPATISMAVSYFGRPELEWHAAQFLKPNPDDKNVRPDELATYAQSLGLRADNLYAGDVDRLKRLVALGIPVLVSTWYEPDPNDGMGHYRLLMGYDDSTRQFYFYDSYVSPGVNLRIGYDKFDEDWRVYSRAYLPVYTPDQADVVAAIVEGDLDESALQQRALRVAAEEAAARPGSPYSWFNLGTALTRLGRTAEAAQAFDRARAGGLPPRLLWYQFWPLEAYLAENRFSEVLALADYNLQQAWEMEESQYYRGKALEGLGQRAQARAAFETALRVNPKYTPALHAIHTMNLASGNG
jgi:tetratricopeptide (TPR) repeat protein